MIKTMNNISNNKYIDSSQLKKSIGDKFTINREVPYNTEDRLIQSTVTEIYKIIQEQSSVDVAEIVRCRNCKHHHWEQEPCHGRTEHFCSVLNAQVFADFYCYHGTKKERE